MKLLNKDFKRLMKGYKAIKTVLKSESTRVSLFNDYATVATPNSTLIIGLETEGYQEALHFDNETFNTLDKLKIKDDVIFTKDQVSIGSKNLSVHTVDIEPSPQEQENFKQVFSCKADFFKRQLKAVSLAIGYDENRPVLKNVLLENGTLVAVDGHRIFTRKLKDVEHSNEHGPMLIQKNTVDVLLKLLPNKSDDLINFCVDLTSTNKYAIQFGEYLLIDELGTGVFMKWDRAFIDECNYEIEFNKIDLIVAVDFVANAVQDNVKIVTFETGRHLLKISNFYGSCEIPYENYSSTYKEPLKIAFNAKYLLDSLKSIEDSIVNLKFISSLTPCIIEHDLGKDLILPIRLNK